MSGKGTPAEKNNLGTDVNNSDKELEAIDYSVCPCRQITAG